MTNFKKVFAFILVVCMVLSMGTAAFAANGCPAGICTEADATRGFKTTAEVHVGTCAHGGVFTEEHEFEYDADGNGECIVCEYAVDCPAHVVKSVKNAEGHRYYCEACGYDTGVIAHYLWTAAEGKLPWEYSLTMGGYATPVNATRTCAYCSYTETCDHSEGTTTYVWKWNNVHHAKCSVCGLEYMAENCSIVTDKLGYETCSKNCGYEGGEHHHDTNVVYVPVDENGEKVEKDALAYGHMAYCETCEQTYNDNKNHKAQDAKGIYTHEKIVSTNPNQKTVVVGQWDALNKMHFDTCSVCGKVAEYECKKGDVVVVEGNTCGVQCEYFAECGETFMGEHKLPEDFGLSCDIAGVCENCGITIAEAVGHNLVTIPGYAVDCSKEGDERNGKEDFTYCTKCEFETGGEVITFDDDNEEHHDYIEITEIPGDCYTNGKIRKVCADCGKETEVLIDCATTAACHSGKLTFYKYLNDIEPDCDDSAIALYECSACHAKTIQVEVEELGHQYTQVRFDTENADADDIIDCTTGVWAALVCTRETNDGGVCGDEKTERELIENPKGDHSWKKIGSVEETCTSYGGTLYECRNTYCGTTKLVCEDGEEILNPELNNKENAYHKVDVLDTDENGELVWPENLHVKVEATCLKKGFEAYYCPTCDALIEKTDAGWVTADEIDYDDEIDHSNAADPVHVEGEEKHANKGWDYTPNTCKTLGYWESNCEWCGQNARKFYDTDCGLAEHKWVEGKFVGEVVCGKTAYVEEVCEYCGIVKVDADGEVVLKPVELTGDREHDWVADGKPVVAPTCGKDGKGYVVCSRCGKRSFETLKATGDHEFVYMELPATCTEPAKLGWFCVGCDAKKADTVYEEKGTALNHANDTAWKTIDTTTFCGYNSYILVQECSLCGATRMVDLNLDEIDVDLYEDAHVMAAYTGDEDDAIVVDAADCLNDGLWIVGGVCTKCGYTPNKDAIEYKYIEGKHVAPAGTVEVKYCNGTYKIYDCEVCLAEVVEVVDKDNKWTGDKLDDLNKHFPDAIEWDVIIANGCTTEGLGTPYCTACGWKAEEAAVIPAAHTWSKNYVVIEAPTCAADGYGYKVCTVCGEEGEIENISNEGIEHEFARFIRESYDCSLPSYVVFACVNCNAKCEDTELLEELNIVYKPVANFTYYDAETKAHVTIALPTAVEEVDNGATSGSQHNWGEAEYREANCQYGAGVRKTCQKCGLEEYVGNHGEPLEHDEYVNIVEPNCYVAGSKVTKCFACGAVIYGNDYADAKYPEKTMTIPKTGHDMVADEEDPRNVAATCSTTGIIVEKCANGCGNETLVVTDYDDDNHVWNTIFELQAMDCAAKKTGLALQDCALCDIAQQVRSTPITHEWNDGEVLLASDCVNEGKIKYTCTKCDATKTEIIPRTAHNMVTISQPADCVNDAMIVTKCEDCDLVTNKIKVGSKALGHIWSEKSFVPADCYNDGSWKWECLREGCDEFYTETVKENGQVKYPKLAHKGAELISTTPANCKDGTIKTYYCAICNEEFSEEDTDVAYGVHTWKVTSENADEITCANPGWADRECTVCGIKQTNKWTTVAHKMSDYVYTKDYIYKFCLVCGHIETTYVAPTFSGFAGCTSVVFEGGVKKLVGSHKGLVVKAGKEGSCTEAGQIEHIECTVCGTVIQQGAVIPAHNTVATPAVAADCTNVGYTAGVYCNDCKEYVSGHEEIPALGHKPVEVPAVDATITTPGYTAGVQCSVCGEWLEGHELVAQKDAVVLRLCTVRSKPADFRDDSESKVVNMLEKGTEVQITGALVNEYYPVAGGYIHMNYLGVAA